ncbi:MAG: hypothetical protein ABJ360_13115, partial [Roseobacter sp.]
MKWDDRLWIHILMLCISSGLLGLSAGCVLVLGTDAAYWGTPVAEGGQTPFQIVQAIVFFVGAIVTLTFAMKRTQAATKQADTANKQAVIANAQTKIARHGMQIERFQKALDMIGVEKDQQCKLAGLRTLETLASEDPEILFEQVSYCFMDYVRERTKANNREFFDTGINKVFLQEKHSRGLVDQTNSDVVFALNALFRLRTTLNQPPIFKAPIQYDLSDTSFEFVELANYNLRDTKFAYSWCNEFTITNCDLTDCEIKSVYGSGMIGSKCNISNAFIYLQEYWEISECYFHPDNPPKKLTVVRPKMPVAPLNKYTFYPKQWPIVLPPDFTGTYTE